MFRSDKISVGRSVGQENFFKTFYFLKKHFRSAEISVGWSGKLFKNFLLFKKHFRSDEISVGWSGNFFKTFYFLRTLSGRATKHGSVEDKQAIFFFFFLSARYEDRRKNWAECITGPRGLSSNNKYPMGLLALAPSSIPGKQLFNARSSTNMQENILE